jgi:ankyrin repeat protein
MTSILLLGLLLPLAGNQAFTAKERMIVACFEGNSQGVNSLVEECDTLDFLTTPAKSHSEFDVIQNGDEWTPLTAAIAGRQWVIAGFLIGRGADPNVTTKHGYHPIWLLAEYGDESKCFYQLVKLMVNKVIDINCAPLVTVDSLEIESAIDRALARLDVEMVRLLLSNGAEVDQKVRSSSRSRFERQFERLQVASETGLSTVVSDVNWKKALEIEVLLAGEKPK